MLGEWIGFGTRVALGCAFLYAATRKLADGEAFGRATRRLIPWARPSAPYVVFVLPLVEATLSVALLSGAAARVAAGVGLALVAGLTGVILYAARRGTYVNCGCFGSSKPAGPRGVVIRNAGLALVAAAVLVAPTDRAANASSAWLARSAEEEPGVLGLVALASVAVLVISRQAIETAQKVRVACAHRVDPVQQEVK